VSLEKLVTMKMTMTQFVIFTAYMVATCIALFLFGTRERGWGDPDRLVYVVNETRKGDLPDSIPPGWPSPELYSPSSDGDKKYGRVGEDPVLLWILYATWCFILGFQGKMGSRAAEHAADMASSRTSSEAAKNVGADKDGENDGSESKGEGRGNFEDSLSEEERQSHNSKSRRISKATKAKYSPPVEVEISPMDRRKKIGSQASIWDGGTRGISRSSTMRSRASSNMSALGDHAEGGGKLFGSLALSSFHEDDEDEEQDTNFLEKTGGILGPGIV